MIEIRVDDRTFFLSEKTLKANPQFIITQMMNNDTTISSEIVERIDKNIFIIDASPSTIEAIVADLREATSEAYTQTIHNLLFRQNVQDQESPSVQKDQRKNSEEHRESVSSHIGGSEQDLVISQNTGDKPSIFKKVSPNKQMNMNMRDFSVASDNNSFIDHPDKLLDMLRGGDQTSTAMLRDTVGDLSVSERDTNRNTKMSVGLKGLSDLSGFSGISDIGKHEDGKASDALSATSVMDTASSTRSRQVYKPRKIELNTVEAKHNMNK